MKKNRTFRVGDLEISLNRRGAGKYAKASYPVRYGCYSEIKTGKYIFQFNLNGEIKNIQGRIGTWDDPTEWLKRTVSNDWVFYSSGGYNGAYSKLGEHYIPCFNYPTNAIIGGKPFENHLLESSISSLYDTLDELTGACTAVSHPDLQAFIASIAVNRGDFPAKRARQFHSIIGGPVSVLPPDARHVDYDVIPLTISDGCLYNCRFCRVKSGKGFSRRHRDDISLQIDRLREFFAEDIKNYNSLFLGEHDALNAGAGLISFAAQKAHEVFEFASSNLSAPSLFLFGSIDSLLLAPEGLFDTLNRLPYTTYINIGLESADEETLALLGKPVTAKKVSAAFARMIEVNRRYPDIEVTANFVLGEAFNQGHYGTFDDLVRKGMARYYSKGALYLSPMGNIANKRRLVEKFRTLKNSSRLPTFLYLIQRL